MNASEDGYSFADYMSGIEEQMKALMRDTSRAPKDMYEHATAFASAIDWKENIIRGLIAFHAIFWLLLLVFRKNVEVQVVAFFVISLLVFLSERINTFCAANWQAIASQNYFDTSGVFAGMMFSGPLLIMLLFQLINFLVLTSDALITAKRLELKIKMKKQEISEKKAGESLAPENISSPRRSNRSKGKED